VTQDPFEVAWTSQVNAEVRVDVIDVAGDVATSCQRFGAVMPCGG